jgi:hypothetical protein
MNFSTCRCPVIPNWDFLGVLYADGGYEHFGLIDARQAHWHHSWLVSDLEKYNRDDTLRYAIMHSPVPPHSHTMQLSGKATLDPYYEGAEQIEDLATKLLHRGMLRDMPVGVVDQCFQTIQEGKLIGILEDWINF